MFRLYNLILLLLPFSSHALECACRGYAECENFLDAAPAGKCSGSYCFVARRTPEEPPIRQGCIDTHQDVSTVSKCVRNRRGAVFCVCNTDNCNGADHEMTDITDLPTIFCHVINDDMDASVGRTCVSHSCYQTQALRVVEFNDLRQTSMEYGCTTPLYYDSSLRIMRGPLDFADDYQYFIQSTPIIVESGRICSTNLCNKPAHIYVQMGDVLCYVHNGRDAPDMCRGEICFTHSPRWGRSIRGCISSTMNSELFLQADGKHNYKYCNYNLCNGDSLNSSSSEHKNTFVVFILILITITVFPQVGS